MHKYTLKVYPKGRGRDVYRVIEIGGNASLDNLCGAILDAFDFIDEHLYEFCMNNRMYDEYNIQCNPRYEGQLSTNIELDQLNLFKGQTFSLHYDFGDDWMFAIHVQKIEQYNVNFVPSVLKSKGTIEQYPDWDSDWDDEDDF